MTVDGVRYVFKDLEATAQWSTEDVLIGADDMDDGRNNMAVVKSIFNWKELYPAFALVDALNVNGVTGWYLPAFNESVDGYGYSSSYYWSSTECSSDMVYAANYSHYEYIYKSNRYSVMAIHRF